MAQRHNFFCRCGNRIIGIAGGEGINHIANAISDKFEFFFLKSARCARRSA